MFDLLRDMFKSPPQEQTIALDAVVDRFHSEKSDELAQTRERADAFRADVMQSLEDVEDALERLEAYEHDNTRVADVTTNVARDRLQRINQLTVPDDLETFHTALTELVEEMRSVTEKENAVMNFVGDPVKTVFKRVNTVENHLDRLDSFCETDYQLVTDLRKLEQYVDRWHDLHTEQNELTAELDDLDLVSARNNVQEVTEALEHLNDHPKQERKTQLLEQITTLESKREALQNDVKTAASRMERGLKKLLYAARNGDVELTVSQIQVLEHIQTGVIAENFSSTTDTSSQTSATVSDAMIAALDQVDRIELGERNLSRFKSGAETLQNLSSIREELEDVNTEIAAKQEQLDEIGIDEQRGNLEDRLARAKDNLKNLLARQQELNDRIADVQMELTETRKQIEQVLNKHLHDEFTVTLP